MRGNVVGALVAALVTVGAAGCGSSGPLSRADLAKQANAICKQRRADIEKLRKRYGRDFTALVVAAIPIVDKSVSDLAKLKPAGDVKAKYEEFVLGERIQIEQLKRGAAAIKAHRRPPAEPRTGPEPHRRAATKEQLGLTACL